MHSYETDLTWDFSDDPLHIEKVINQIVQTDPYFLPPCMLKRGFNCRLCRASVFPRCLLKIDPDFTSFLICTSGTREKLNGRRLGEIMLGELEKFGLPVHYEVLYKAVQVVFPKASLRWVLSILNTSSDSFTKIEIGVYGLVKWESQRPNTSS